MLCDLCPCITHPCCVLLADSLHLGPCSVTLAATHPQSRQELGLQPQCADQEPAACGVECTEALHLLMMAGLEGFNAVVEQLSQYATSQTNANLLNNEATRYLTEQLNQGFASVRAPSIMKAPELLSRVEHSYGRWHMQAIPDNLCRPTV